MRASRSRCLKVHTPCTPEWLCGIWHCTCLDYGSEPPARTALHLPSAAPAIAPALDATLDKEIASANDSVSDCYPCLESLSQNQPLHMLLVTVAGDGSREPAHTIPARRIRRTSNVHKSNTAIEFFCVVSRMVFMAATKACASTARAAKSAIILKNLDLGRESGPLLLILEQVQERRQLLANHKRPYRRDDNSGPRDVVTLTLPTSYDEQLGARRRRGRRCVWQLVRSLA